MSPALSKLVKVLRKIRKGHPDLSHLDPTFIKSGRNYGHWNEILPDAAKRRLQQGKASARTYINRERENLYWGSGFVGSAPYDDIAGAALIMGNRAGEESWDALRAMLKEASDDTDIRALAGLKALALDEFLQKKIGI